MFRVIDHTADIRLLIEGKSTEELFTEAAAGMFSVIAGGRLSSKLKATKSLRGAVARKQSQRSEGLPRSFHSLAMTPKFKINVVGTSLEELLVSFLNELLYLSDKKRAIFNEFRIKVKESKNEFYLKGEVKKNSQIPKREIKAATYHDLRIEKKDNFWQTRIIFDI